jgi:hypothetical protein
LSLARPRFGLPAALLRHGVVVLLAIGAVLAQGMALQVSVSDRPWSWVAVSAGLGALAAIVARGLMGALFLVIGLLVGVEVLLIYQHDSAAEAIAVLRQDGWLYAALVAAALAAYFVVLLILMRFRRA